MARLLSASFPSTRFLSSRGATSLLARLEGLGIAGGSIYDALVAAAAIEHGSRWSRGDLRALDTYRALEADVELLR